MNPLVSVAVEGRSDIGMVTTLVGYIGLDLARSILVKNGGAKLDVIIPKLARTSVHNPWIAFRDADRHCPVELRTRLIGDRAHDGAHELRLAASMTEAWLLADEQAFAHYFDVPPAKVPLRPDELPHFQSAPRRRTPPFPRAGTAIKICGFVPVPIRHAPRLVA